MLQEGRDCDVVLSSEPVSSRTFARRHARMLMALDLRRVGEKHRGITFGFPEDDERLRNIGEEGDGVVLELGLAEIRRARRVRVNFRGRCEVHPRTRAAPSG